MRKLLALSWLLLVPLAAGAQTVRGVVVEDGTRAPVAGAAVDLLDAERVRVATARTDSTGAFVLLPRRAGSFVLRLARLGFAPVDSAALTLRPGETVEIELRMGRRAIPLEPLVVTTRVPRRLAEFHERRRRPGAGRFLTRADIEQRPGTIRTTDLLRTMPGVQVVSAARCPGCPSTQLITMRGGCVPTIYLDGVAVAQYPGSGMDEILPPSIIEGVEVYTGFASAPSPLLARNACGVVAFWTRTGEPGARWSWRRLFTAAGLIAAVTALTNLLH